jgi:predicted O-methyltransferase YrrM
MITAIRTAVTVEEQAKLQEMAFGRTVLELGSYAGASTVAMAQVAHRVHAVDWHQGDESAGTEDTLAEFFANIQPYRDRIVAHVGRFEDIVPLFREGAFDMAFLDGAHSYEATVAQIDLALRVLKPGSVIAFHDYGSGFDGVKQAIDQYFLHVDVIRTLAWTTT